MVQLDALAYSDLRRALELGYCPTIARLMNEHPLTLRRWFCGLPSATPYCQAGIFHGENAGIPAFRFYDKERREVITCNAPAGVQYIRDRITAPGALAGGSSYVNLLDGDAEIVGFTVATRVPQSVFRRLGGTRMLLLLALHPIRVLRMVFQALGEWLLEEWERFAGEWSGRYTHAEGVFPLVRMFTNVVVRELQTMAVMLDVYLGVPVIYTTFMQYDELSHHFGPSSRQALIDLRRTDARLREIWRMMRTSAAGGREYDLVILSDHGSTPSVSYRVRYGESLGSTVQRLLDGVPVIIGGQPLQAVASFAESSEFADVGPHVMEGVGDAAGSPVRHALHRMAHWLRTRYGLRELLLPEKYRIAGMHKVVVTYSSCLAHLYFADDPRALDLEAITTDRRRTYLYRSLLAHPGIGLVLTRDGAGVHVEGRAGRARLAGENLRVISGENPLEPYGTEPHVIRSVVELVQQHNAGDFVLFGAYDGYDIVSFDDQVGAHGCVGGDQAYPFVMAPAHWRLDEERLENARDIHRTIMTRERRTTAAAEPGTRSATA